MSFTREKNINARQEVVPEKLGPTYLIIGVVTFVLGFFLYYLGYGLIGYTGNIPFLQS